MQTPLLWNRRLAHLFARRSTERLHHRGPPRFQKVAAADPNTASRTSGSETGKRQMQVQTGSNYYRSRRPSVGACGSQTGLRSVTAYLRERVLLELVSGIRSALF